MENKIYGYARCSTNEEKQDIERQKRELFSLGVTDEKFIYWEYESGTKFNRPEFQKLLEIISEGDTICTTEVSRLTRSTSDLCKILEIVKEKKTRLIIGTLVFDCSKKEIDPMTKGMLMLWGVFAEMERDMISERVKSGLKNAKDKGKKLGRPKATLADIPKKFWNYYPKFKDGELTITDLSNLTSSSRTTIYKYINRIEKEKK